MLALARALKSLPQLLTPLARAAIAIGGMRVRSAEGSARWGCGHSKNVCRTVTRATQTARTYVGQQRNANPAPRPTGVGARRIISRRSGGPVPTESRERSGPND